MITYIKKDITTVSHGVVGHGVNCKGVMGSGVAKSIRDKWPVVFDKYVKLVNNQPNDLLGIGQVVEIVPDDLYVMNCFTQENFGKDGQRYADPVAVETALNNIAAYAAHKQLPIYIPRIGCKLGGLSWETEIKPMLESIEMHPAWYPSVEWCRAVSMIQDALHPLLDGILE